MKITGPYPDVKGSQSLPFAVTLYEPGHGVKIERFTTSEEAQAFADRARAEYPEPDKGDTAA